MDENTTQDADAAEMAALYRRADEARKAFFAAMGQLATIWRELQEARVARDAFKAAYKAKYRLGGN